MNELWPLWLIVGVVVLIAVLYALHRLCLWLEAEGYMYYVKQKPQGGGGFSALVELQRSLEPTTRHVSETKEERVVLMAKDADGDAADPRQAGHDSK